MTSPTPFPVAGSQFLGTSWEGELSGTRHSRRAHEGTPGVQRPAAARGGPGAKPGGAAARVRAPEAPVEHVTTPRGAQRAGPRGGGGGESNGGRGRLRGVCASGVAARLLVLRGSPGWSATSAARAGPPTAVQQLCLPRRPAGTSGERPLGPRSEPDNGGGLLPSTRESPGRAPAAPRNCRPYLSCRSVDSAWQAVDFGAVSRRVRRGPSQWNWRTVCAAWDPTRGNLRTGCALGNLPRAWDLLVPSLPSSPRHPLPGSPALVPAAACGQSETLGSGTLRSRDSGSSDADQGQNLPPAAPHSP